MITPRQLEKSRAGMNLALIIAFIGLLWLPVLDSFFHWDTSPSNENRAFARFPVWNRQLAGLRAFFVGLDVYYSDHFGFRLKLLGWQQHWERRWFNQPPTPDVIIGREGWLYFSGENMIDNFRAIHPFQPVELQKWQTLLENRRDWLAQRGIRYAFVVAPDKQSIYPEYLPDWLTLTRPLTKLDQFIAHMKANSTVPVADLRPALLSGRSLDRMYFRTDTHWSQYGAFIGCQQLIKILAPQMPGLQPLPLTAFEKTRGPMQQVGDLARMLGQSMLEDDCPYIEPRAPLRPLPAVKDPKFFGKDWDPGMEPVVTINPDRKGTAIVFRDSFSEFWVPYLGQHFNKVIYLWQYSWDLDIIKSEKPDVVIDEMLERRFYVQDPSALDQFSAVK